MSATSDEQGVPAGETPEVRRNLTTDVLAYALGAATSDVVTDAYGGIKAAGKAVVDKIRDRGPEADPPAHDNDSAELVTALGVCLPAHRRRDHTHATRPCRGS